MGNNISRKHHYISRHHLSGFVGNKSKLTVIDLSNKKTFFSSPEGVCAVRDFNKVTIDGLPQDHYENQMSQFESLVADAIKNIHDHNEFSGKDKDVLLNYVALISARNPRIRNIINEHTSGTIKLLKEALTSNINIWNDHLRKMGERESTVEEFKKIQNLAREHETQYKWDNNFFIPTELKAAKHYLGFLAKRNWCLIRPASYAGNLIINDHPVSLVWKKPRKKAFEPFNSFAGHFHKESVLYFPLSKKLGLVGEFEEQDYGSEHSIPLIAYLNSIVFYSAKSQIYSPNLEFYTLNKEENIVSGDEFLNQIF